jgi:tol-pal system protein YbgF
MTKTWLFLGLTATSLITSPALHAEVSSEQALQLLERIGAIEEENRELRGQNEEMQHQLTTLTQDFNTLKSDVDYRLNTPESETTAAPPLPLANASPPVEDSKTSAISSNADQEYEKARTFLEQGDYDAAEQSFAAFVSSHPKDKLAGPAQYWLGVTFFVRGQHEKAVAAFAKGYKSYPKAPKAAENLLKLAKSLKALGRNADACMTLDQLMADFPQSLADEVGSERKELKCK